MPAQNTQREVEKTGWGESNMVKTGTEMVTWGSIFFGATLEISYLRF